MKTSKETLWIRKLSCGHERPTNLAFLCGDYKKPKIGETAYCRICCKEVKIIEVYKDEQ